MYLKTNQILLQCVPKEKKPIISYYIEYGTVIGNKLESKKFLEDMEREEFETYQHIPLYDQPKNYV